MGFIDQCRQGGKLASHLDRITPMQVAADAPRTQVERTAYNAMLSKIAGETG
jgi:hypothetical protein